MGQTRLVVPSADAFPSSGSAVFAVSPDDILVSTRPPDHISARNVLRGTLVAKQDSDTGDWIRVAAGGIEWTVRLTQSAAVELRLAPGSEVWLAVKTHTLHAPALTASGKMERRRSRVSSQSLALGKTGR